MSKPYASWTKICALILLFVIYRDYLPGEPSPFISVNLEIASKSSIARETGRLVFPIVWFGCVVSILLSPFLSASLLRVPLVLTFLFSWLFSVTVLNLSQVEGSVDVPTENMIDSGTLALFWIERRKLLDTLHTYSEVVPTLIAFALVALIFAWRPSRKISVRGKWNVVACLPIAMVVAMAAYSRGGTSAFPTPVGLPIRFASAIAFVAKQDEVAESFHARPVTLRPVEKRFEKIILIMDESVRAGFVDPDLMKKWGLIDYGAAVSAGNCSHFSRFIFKRGLKPADLPKAFMAHGLVSEEPTVWQFAKAAGFKTVYIDAVGDAVFHSGMNSDELGYIDERYNIHTRPTYMRDFDALKRLFDVVSQPGPAFIYLDKQGVHHPYQDKYPANEALAFEGPAVKVPEDKDLREYQRNLLGRYNRAIDWSVDRFLSELFAHGLPENTLLVYTSDHGQSLVENSTKWTHCSAGPATVDGEGLVPLLAYARPDTPIARLLREDAGNFRGKYSHFQVFPTLLIAMGFPVESVTQSYGSSLLDPPPSTRRFLKGGDVRQLEWQTVE
jgi:glucan phosphoethanolaminetransferase (alkaline phosphatase superfamily)